MTALHLFCPNLMRWYVSTICCITLNAGNKMPRELVLDTPINDRISLTAIEKVGSEDSGASFRGSSIWFNQSLTPSLLWRGSAGGAGSPYLYIYPNLALNS